MTQPYVGEVRMFAGNFAPAGWQICDGSILSIAENDVLFNLIGTTYGGDGQTTFAVPDLRGRSPFHQGTSAQQTLVIGQPGGAETVTLTTPQIPAHSHQLAGSSTATGTTPSATVPAAGTDGQYSTATSNAALSSQAVGTSGGSQPHENRSPYLAINFIISLFGIYPSQG
jgi:microcystin-dependent protein